MKKVVVLVSTIFTLIIILCYVNIVSADERKLDGECFLPPSTSGIRVYSYEGTYLVAYDVTDSNGYYYIDGDDLEEDVYYKFYTTNDIGYHTWYFYYDSGNMEHDFALGVPAG